MVEVSLLGNAAIVRLMDSSNFSSFRAGRSHRYQGGRVTESPVLLRVPYAGHWFVTIDLGGYGGSVRSGVRVLPGRPAPLPDLPLAAVPSLVQRDQVLIAARSTRGCDVFIAHAAEDRDSVVRPLAQALRGAGLRVWDDEFELRVGDNLSHQIERGLAGSRFGVVVLSPSFFAAGWPLEELDGLVMGEADGQQVLLPIWHKLTKQEVIGYSPSLADTLARNTATHTIDEIAEEIAALIGAVD